MRANHGDGKIGETPSAIASAMTLPPKNVSQAKCLNYTSKGNKNVKDSKIEIYAGVQT